jgi:serine acetyltransferase
MTQVNKENGFMQMRCFVLDYKRSTGAKKIRMFYIWMNRAIIGILLYRFERMNYLIFGRYYAYLRIVLLPVYRLLEVYSNVEIHYRADIGPGLMILHPAGGVIISGNAKVGTNLTLTGGNFIGMRHKRKEEFRIGNQVTLGANAVILGPLVLGNHVMVGSSALVTKSFGSGVTLVGVPAKILRNTQEDSLEL